MKRWLLMELRRFFKKPKDLKRAAIIKRRLSFVYLFLAWNAFGLYVYSRIKEEFPMTPTEQKLPALWYLRLIGEKEATVLSFEGFKQKSHTHFDANSQTLTPVKPDTIFSSADFEDETEQIA
ncbi:uncharacterized protein [Chelonus insularis]|uniref:uncharacterized protein n=1 Tax=Chelonus insularis TaxID=460826 RepID=UPI00158E3C39|nr:uncharacterized protein LOC118068025 [Chelonus insularis]XP_034941031.1 uncharacterized protein LOC118068025 [Chelonus insularis]